MEEIIIAKSMAINITDWYIVITVLGIGIVLGMYIVTQIKESIESNIRHRELMENIKKYDEKKKTK